MKSIYLSAFILLISACTSTVFGQGCVAVKNMASSCTMAFDSTDANGSWQFALNYRFFRSYKHFSGTEEHKNRVEQGTEVINNDNSVILGITRTLNPHWSFSATIPFMYIDRSSLYEHDRTNRYHTLSKGLGDVRLSAYYNAIAQNIKGNLTFGLGTKLPTGNYNYKDYFHRPEGLELRPVDQSIQLGDGGLGITAEFDASRKISGNIYAYANGLYLFNPRNTNGTLTYRSNPYEDIMSVADQYFLRAGARYNAHNFQASLGVRAEGVPVEDLIGKSDGFRRPGYIISAEPSFYYTAGRHTAGFNLPIALVRNRTRSLADIKYSADTNQHRHGDAAFADWLLSITYAYRM